MPESGQHRLLARHFVTLRGQFGTRQVHYRRGGAGPVVLLLHQSPQSSAEMEPLIEAWGRRFTLIAPDSPGYGYSGPLEPGGQPVTTASIGDFAAATLELADALGIRTFGVYGYHTGASIGMALAEACPGRVTAVAANGLVVLTSDERGAILRDYLPPLIPRWDGGHLAWLWARLREQTIFFPWHDRRAATRLDFDVPSADHLQQGLQEFLAAGDHYRVGYAAAFTDNAAARLPGLRVPVLITAAGRDPLAPHLARIGARSEAVEVAVSADAGEALDRAFAHLARHAVDNGPLATATATSPVVSDYRGAPGRQLRIRRTASRDAENSTVILLHAPAGSACSVAALATLLAAHAEVLAVDLPGHGASDPLPAVEPARVLAGHADQLAAALAPTAGRGPVTVVAVGSSAPLAAELATRLDTRTRALLLDPPLWTVADVEDWLRNGLPPLTPAWSGGHLLEAWHLVRDGHLFAPWFRREHSHIRPGEPDLDERRLHEEVRDLLRANGAWQALLRASLTSPAAVDARYGAGITRLDTATVDWAASLGRAPRRGPASS